MKRTLLFFLPILSMFGLPLHAASQKIYGIYYNLNSEAKTAEVANHPTDKCSGDIVIPPSVTYEGVEYSVTGISEFAFYLSTDLISVTIPNSVTHIGALAFHYCTNLQNIYCYAEQIPETGMDPFQLSNYTNATLHVPTASVSAYQAVEPWKDFKEIVALPDQGFFPEGTKWTEIRLDTLKFDHWYSKVGDKWMPNYEIIEYYVKGEYLDKYGRKFRCVYTNGPEWTDSLTFLLQEEGDAEYVEPNCVMVSVLVQDYDGSSSYIPLWPGVAYQFYWSVGKGLYYEDILMSNTTSIGRSRFYYGIIDEIKEKSFGGIRPLKYVDLEGKAPANNPNSPIQNVKTKGGRIIQGIGITEWNDGECLFGPVCPYEALSESYHSELYPERHYRSMLVHFERDNEVLYDVWPDKLPPIEINEQTFPDKDFRKWVLSQKYGKDGKLTKEEIDEVTFMNLFPQNIIAEGHIKSLKGIEYFTAVTRLVCSRNELTELDLSKNTALTWLECYGNHLTELDLSKNTELTNLDCNSNELTALDVSCCKKLTEINCMGNKLTTLNASGCSALTILKCYANQLAVIDISDCASLATMWASDNQLSALNFLDCTSLSTLWCDNNQLTQLDVSNNTNLTDLRCGDNKLTQLDVSNNTELKELRCNDNKLTALDLSMNKMLTSLRTYHNPIKGKAMDALIESLPTASRGSWCCVLSEDEVGVATIAQVAAAKAKGWTSCYWNEAAKNWMEYDGSETAQDEYRPFVEDGKVWKVGDYSGNPVLRVEYYYFDGDTIINGKTCKQMMLQRYVNPDHPDYAIISQLPSQNYVGAWYEEDKKVYFYNAANNHFKLMYDFSLEDNGTFLTNDLSYVIGPRQTGGVKGFKGVHRDVMMPWDGELLYNTTWLEGVGGIDGPMVRVYYGEEGHAVFLMACYVGDEVIYYNDEYEDGATPAEARKNRIDFTHTIKIKPKTRMRGEDNQALYGEYNEQQLSINLDPINYAYMVSITDESGNVVYEKDINAGNIVGLNIDISKYPKGLYTVTVENSNESFTGEFKAQMTGIETIRSKKPQERDFIYNLQGQRLSTMQKGLNIVNGKKVYVK